jgi:AraC family transcriptional activator of mtrCDE
MRAVLLDKLLSNLDIHVEPFSLCEVSPGRRLVLPGSARVMLHFVIAGSGFVRSAAGTVQPLEPCSLAVVPRKSQHSLEPKGETGEECFLDPDAEHLPSAPVISTGSVEPPEMIVACGLVKVRYGAALGLFDKLEDVVVEDLSDIPQARAAFEIILAEQTTAGPGSEAMKAALMSQCIVYLLRRLCEGGTCSLPWLAALEDERLARVLDRILQDPADSHTVESLAGTASMSRSAFSQTFTRAFDVPPMSMVRRIRMERALGLLERGDDLSMEAVARRVGFSSRSHFSRTFKKHFGVSPVVRRAMPS